MCLSVVKSVFLTFLMLPCILCAQDVKELNQRFGTIFKDLRPAERTSLVDRSVESWTSGFFSQAEKDSVEAVFERLQTLRVTANPELKNFLQCVNAFRIRDEKGNLQVWLNGLKKKLTTMDNKRNVVRDYLVGGMPVVCEQVIAVSSGHKWVIKGKAQWLEGENIRLVFKEADLICRTDKDSVVIFKTNITNSLGGDEISGNGGTVKWRAPADSITASLTRYSVNVKMSEYSADSVWLNYESKYGKPILGKLKDNVSKFSRTGKIPFPEFTSYATDIKIDPLFPDIAFQGGISYTGSTLSGFGTAEHPAFLRISPNDTIDMYVYAGRFSIDSSRIMTGSASLVIHLDSGRITHPDINFLYTDARHTATIKRITERSQHLPFKDSYHRILFTMEEIIWPLDSNCMELRMSSRSGLFKAVIESQNFFNDNVYDNIQGMDEINPLNGLLKCAVQLKSNTFTLSEYTEFIKKPADQLRKQIILLSYNDFLDYNEKRDEVTLKQRLFDYTKARVGKQDYDNIRFTSLPQDSRINALLDVRNFNLTILGVEKFTISDEKDVYVEPSDKKVVMMRNRDMLFNGKLRAGMFDMFGSNLYFSYDKYAIDLTKVDSANMFMAGVGADKRGDKVKSLLRDIKGDIVIDKPDNKSGKKKDETFPMLNSKKESYVYFDDKSIQEGGYKRDSFYYVVKPYTMKGINDAENLHYAFAGTLVSNIVSPIVDTLRLMKDNSLGVAYKTPAAGLELYGRGRLRGSLILDRGGFLSQANVEINKSKFQSDTILMLPSRMIASTKLIDVSAIAGKRPEAKGENVKLKYLAKNGNLQASSIDKPFGVYKGRIQHKGTLSIYDELMDASGQLELKDAVMQSKLFKLKDNNILSSQTSLKISAISDDKIQLNTGNVSADIDLVKNKGRFVNNAEANHVNFSSSHYSCSFKNFTWYMQESYLNIGIEDEAQLAKIWKIENPALLPEQGRNVFLAMDKLADSLSFVAPLARYDLKNGDINCRWVNHIDVANGRFYPDKGEVFIKGQGGLQEFVAGLLLCNRADSTQKLTDVSLSLKGKNNFNGSGDFKYTSEEKKTSIIRFSEIHADTNHLIYAKAVIAPEKPLLLNDGFTYKGNIILRSGQRNLSFEGYTGLTSDKDYLKHTWLAVDATLDSKKIKIPVEVENRDDNKQRIFNGIFLNVDKTTKPYVSFLSTRVFYNDDRLIGGKGNMVWSGALKQYIIDDTLADRYYTFRYDHGSYTIAAFGKLNLSLNTPGIHQHVAGDITYDLKEEKLDLKNILYLIDFELLGKMKITMQKDFSDQKLKNITVNKLLNEKIYSVFGKQNMPAMNKVIARSTGNIPDSLNRMFVLDSMSFAWNTTTKSYVSNGDVKVVNIHDKPVDKTMKIKMEVARRRTGDEFFIYLYNDNVWYYFEYSAKALYTISSNEEYNTTLSTEKAEKKIVRTKDDEILYTITLCPDSKKDRFLKRIN